ncbi:MAG TPA: vitamin K epoxide reductase family protein [bacterium]|jgi:uncharacterized membrane protein
MAKTPSQHRRPARPSERHKGAHEAPRIRDWWLVALGAAGVVLSVYLLVVRAAHAPTYCPLGSGCDIIQSSRYAAVFGIPVAAFGLGYYVVMLVLGARTMEPVRRWAVAVPVALAGLAASLVFTVTQEAVIRATCSLCVLSALLTLGIALRLLFRRPARAPGITWAWGTLAAAVSIALLLGGYAVSAPPIAGAVYAEGLAKHLAASGAVFYGAYWCPHCADQKAMFGPAAKYLPYVECDPRGTRADPQLCAAKQVKGFPTWEIAGQRLEGVVSLGELARLSGYPPPPAESP